LLQYLFLHFSGYETWTLDAVKQYHAPIKGNIAAGHPEIEVDGVEVSRLEQMAGGMDAES